VVDPRFGGAGTAPAPSDACAQAVAGIRKRQATMGTSTRTPAFSIPEASEAADACRRDSMAGIDLDHQKQAA